MKLDRNNNPDGLGKYALIKLREFTPVRSGYDPSVRSVGESTEMPWLADPQPVPLDCIDFGDSPDTEFFVIRLKDKYAAAALFAYADAARSDDAEYADEVERLAAQAKLHPHSKRPD